jgi:hypothetical protein
MNPLRIILALALLPILFIAGLAFVFFVGKNEFEEDDYVD